MQGKRMGERGVDWNDQADMYSEFVFCELEDTRSYLDAIGVSGMDSVLDVCCGPGRVSVLCAERGARVTGIDSAEKMLAHARANAAAMSVSDNCDFRLLDWNHVLPKQNLHQHDVVIASRCGAMMDTEKLSALARRTVGVQIFANAPSIPALLGVLFSGCGDGSIPDRGGSREVSNAIKQEAGAQCMGGPMGMSSGFSGSGPRPDGPDAKQSIYLKIAEKAFLAGYDPNIRILPERFRKTFASEEEAIAWVAALKPERSEGNMERLALNVAPFLNLLTVALSFASLPRLP